MNDQLAQLYDLIPDYIKGKLNEEELAKVKAQIDSDKDFADEVKDQKELLLALEMYGDEGVAEEFSQLLDQHIEKSGRAIPFRFPKKWLTIAAAIASLLFIIGLLTINSKTKEAKIIAMDAFPDKVSHKYHEMSNGLTSSIKGLDTLILAMEDYNAENYHDAKAHFLDYFELEEENRSASFYLGLCFLYTGDNSSAITLLKPLAETKSFSLKDEAKLRLASIYWHERQYLKAITLINQLKESPNPSIKERANKIW